MIINFNMIDLFVEFTIEKSEKGNVHTKMLCCTCTAFLLI